MKNNRTMNRMRKALTVALALALCLTTAWATESGAENEAIKVVNNFVDFIFLLIRVAGLAVAGWGLVQVATSIQSHDASQRTSGIWSLVAGVIMFFARAILSSIGMSI